MKCQVTGCGNTAEAEMSISIKPKWGKQVYNAPNRETQTVNICKFHEEMLVTGKLKPKR